MTTSVRGEGQIAYQVLADELRSAIGRGEFEGGKRLPTEAELSARFAISRQTVRRALQDLVAEGLVYRVRGRGSFAVPSTGGAQYLRSFGSIDDLLALSVDTTMELVRPLERVADVNAASRLGLASDQVVVAVIRRLHEAVPFCVNQVFLPVEIGRRVSQSSKLPVVGEASSATLISIVDEVAPEPIVGARQSITASEMPAEFSELIDCKPGSSVLRVDRLYFDRAGRGLELAISHFHPARYSYRTELRRSPRAAAH